MIINPKISVLMSVYNTEESLLKKAIESIQNQSFDDFEFIIVNDGSGEYVDQLVSGYAINDSRIKLISQHNMGLTRALNNGLSQARGKYVARLDSSDLSRKNRLLKQYELMENNPDFVVCWTWFNVVDHNGIKLGRINFSTCDWMIKRRMLKSNIYAHSTAMFSRYKIIDIGGYCDKFVKAQDLELWLRLMRIKNAKFGAVPEYLVDYRYETNSMTVSDDSDQSKFSKLAYYKFYTGRIPENFQHIKYINNNFKYSRKNLYLINLFLRSGANFKAKYLIKVELNKKFSFNLFIKLLMSYFPIDWSNIYRFL